MKKLLLLIAIVLVLIGGIYVYKNDKIEIDTNQNTISDSIVQKEDKNKIENNEENQIEAKDFVQEDNNTSVQNEDKKNTLKNENTDISKDEDTNVKQENNSTSSNKVVNNTKEVDDKKISVKEQLTPSGFMGSSLMKVTLYSNGEVYLINYNGEGYEEKNIVDKELLATNASSIYSKGTREDFEAIVIRGNSNMQVKNRNYSWIEFET